MSLKVGTASAARVNAEQPSHTVFSRQAGAVWDSLFLTIPEYLEQPVAPEIIMKKRKTTVQNGYFRVYKRATEHRCPESWI
jgi:hypothetical protein